MPGIIRAWPGRGWPGGRTLLALFVYQLHVMHGESRIALLWALVGPVVLLTLISSLYILMGTHYILGMDVQTFSLLGATTWIMFRQIIFRSSTAYVSARGLLNFQGVSPLMCALVQALLYVSVYLVVFVVLIGAGHALDLITLPKSWPGFMLYVVLMACCAAAMGLLFGAIATFWHFFLRLAPVIERFLQIFSGVFFVSEQLPEQLRPWMLWLPFSHGMQLLRSAYFDAYTSQDASLGYFLTSLVFLMVVALAAERLARPNIQPM
ncbi:ABC transporter permease [Achromobacter xylosoxidans]|uniref:ABC transporter permease n=1 Tax=Alcaligenes xylosoxydans xylosoxydans TaxID=85698 RepID=UPI000AC1094B